MLFYVNLVNCNYCSIGCVLVLCVKVKIGSMAAGSTDQLKPSTWQHANFLKRRSSRVTTIARCLSIRFWENLWSCL